MEEELKHKITCIGHCCDLHEADLDDEIKKAKEEEKRDNLIAFKEWCACEGIEPKKERWVILFKMLKLIPPQKKKE